MRVISLLHALFPLNCETLVTPQGSDHFLITFLQIGGCACVLVLLFSGLVACSGVFGSPLTDDVATLDTLVRHLHAHIFL